MTFEEKEFKIAQKLSRGTRRHIGIPCDDAQEITDSLERIKHIQNCKICQEMYKRFEDRYNIKGD